MLSENFNIRSEIEKIKKKLDWKGSQDIAMLVVGGAFAIVTAHPVVAGVLIGGGALLTNSRINWAKADIEELKSQQENRTLDL